ncbi:hypothetical protein ACFWN1_03235 [Streptomyces sp. NPDC058459]|uniref:hypothetical protein n=1 Tax=Streptomyces sp. NPDC058459 TaxID=3346508 RepID=UPI00364CD001
MASSAGGVERALPQGGVQDRGEAQQAVLDALLTLQEAQVQRREGVDTGRGGGGPDLAQRPFRRAQSPETRPVAGPLLQERPGPGKDEADGDRGGVEDRERRSNLRGQPVEVPSAPTGADGGELADVEDQPEGVTGLEEDRSRLQPRTADGNWHPTIWW